jgi:hypothetical protein
MVEFLFPVNYRISEQIPKPFLGWPGQLACPGGRRPQDVTGNFSLKVSLHLSSGDLLRAPRARTTNWDPCGSISVRLVHRYPPLGQRRLLAASALVEGWPPKNSIRA